MPTLIEVLIFTCLILVVCIALLLVMKQRDRAIYADLKERFKFERREKEASLEFNTYFLSNNHSAGVVTLKFDSRNYILYIKGGHAIVEEKLSEFTIPEKTFYGFNDPGDSRVS